MLTPYDCLETTEYSNDSKCTKLEKKYFIVCISSYSFIFLILRKYTQNTTHPHTQPMSTTMAKKLTTRRNEKLCSVYQNMYTRYKQAHKNILKQKIKSFRKIYRLHKYTQHKKNSSTLLSRTESYTLLFFYSYCQQKKRKKNLYMRTNTISNQNISVLSYPQRTNVLPL